MPTRLSLICDRVIEAGWLVAAVIIPLHLDPYTARVFEPDKLALLRAIAWVTAGAWLVRTLERSNGRTFQRGHLASTPLAAPILLTVLAYLLASLTSVAPDVSWWGSYQRAQGTVTVLAALVIGLLVLGNLHRRDQLDRMLTAIVLGAWPVSLSAILQATPAGAGLVGPAEAGRVSATAGNPIFLGAYLLFTLPLTIACLLAAWRDRRMGLTTLYAILSLTQATALVLSGSRGPWLGALAAGVIFCLLVAAAWGWRRLALGVIGLATVAGALLLVLNLPGGPLGNLSGVPGLGRLTALLDDQSGTARARVLMWEGAIRLLSSNPARWPAGYGPETQLVVLAAHTSPELGHVEVPGRLPDRAHNAIFDTLITTGALGLVAYLWLLGSVFYYGLAGLGLLAGPRDALGWAVSLVVGGLVGATGLALIGHSLALAALGFTFGAIAAFGFYLVGAALRPRGIHRPAAAGQVLLMAGLLAALAGHVVETGTGLTVASTLLYFWLFAGLVVVVADERRGIIDEGRTGSDERSLARRPSSFDGDVEPTGRVIEISLGWDPAAAADGLVVTAILTTLAFSFLRMPGAAAQVSGLILVGLFSATWLVAAVLVASHPSLLPTGKEAGGEGGPGVGSFVATSLAGPLVFGLWWATSTALGGDATWLLAGFYVIILATVLLLGGTLPVPRRNDRRQTIDERRRTNDQRPMTVDLRPPSVVLRLSSFVIGLAVVFAVITTAFNPIRADVYFEMAQAYAGVQRWDESTFLFQQALGLAPDQPAYYQGLAEMLVQDAEVTPDASQRDHLFSQARSAAERARELNPAFPEATFNLGHLHLLWAQTVEDPGQRGPILDQAIRYYQQAANLSPNNPQVYQEMGIAYQVKNDRNLALASFQQAVAIDPASGQTYVLLGALYRDANRLDLAEQMFQRAQQLEPDLVEAYNGLGDVYQRQGRLEDALAQNLKAAQVAPDDFATHFNLARLYQRLGRLSEAQAEAQLAWNYAPSAQRPLVQQLIDDLAAGQGNRP